MGTNGPMPLVSVQHGTAVQKTDAPSQPNSGAIWALVIASYVFHTTGSDQQHLILTTRTQTAQLWSPPTEELSVQKRADGDIVNLGVSLES